MKRLSIAVALACAPLTACQLEPPVSPGQVADRTVLDEQAGIAIETAYAATAHAAAVGIRSGVVGREQALRIAEVDRRAYAAVLATRQAYDAGNAASYAEAAAIALPLVRELLSTIRGE